MDTPPREAGTVVARAPRMRGARALFTGAGLNLAFHVGDDEEVVRTHRTMVATAVGAPVLFVNQVHSTLVHTVREGDGRDPAASASAVVTADAIVTDRRDLAIAIMVADCLPVLLVDAEAGVIGAAHAGRRGLLNGILANTVGAMADLGADPQRLQVEIGPSICGSCYEVPQHMRAEAVQHLPATWATTRHGTPALDLRAGARQDLERLGVQSAAIGDTSPCTLEDESFYSYRRKPATGRFAGVIRGVDA